MPDRITEIFLDLDDTLNVFSPTAMKFVGCPIDPATYIGEKEFRGNYDLVGRVNSYFPEDEQFELAEFWNLIPREFWANTPKDPDFDNVLNACEYLVGRENIVILTAPTKDPDCLAGKLEWIHQYLPSWLHRQYIVTPRKQYNAGPGRLMVDDSDDNLRAWTARGGSIIRVPRPWNAGWELYEKGLAWKYMKGKFEEFFEAGLTIPASVA